MLAFGVILSMYGGGFATVPAYLADLFGVQYVGAIHGRLLTAWSTAGIVGPVLVNYLHDSRVAEGVPRDHVYDACIDQLFENRLSTVNSTASYLWIGVS